ncbi:MAG: response regulator [Bacteroidales bacterium]
MKKSVIFVVDKNPAHRNLIKFNFERNRFTNVHAFPTAEECLYRMQKKVIPDFVVTGFFIECHSRFDFLHQILAISPSCGVVFFDNFEDREFANRLIEAGARDYVVKTKDPDAGISELLKNVTYLAREKRMMGVQ